MNFDCTDSINSILLWINQWHHLPIISRYQNLQSSSEAERTSMTHLRLSALKTWNVAGSIAEKSYVVEYILLPFCQNQTHSMPEEEMDRKMNAFMTALEAKLSNLQIPPWIHPKADMYIHSAQLKKKTVRLYPTLYLGCTAVQWAVHTVLLRTAFISSHLGKKN